MKKIIITIFLLTISLCILLISSKNLLNYSGGTEDIVQIISKSISTQNIPIALYPSFLTTYCDKAWWNINWNKKESIVSYVKCYYDDDKEFCNYLLKTIQKESSFNIDGISCTGARGLMQILPAAAEDMNYDYLDVINKPWVNIDCGAEYLKFCLRRAKGNKKLAYKLYVNGPFFLLANK